MSDSRHSRVLVLLEEAAGMVASAREMLVVADVARQDPLSSRILDLGQRQPFSSLDRALDGIRSAYRAVAADGARDASPQAEPQPAQTRHGSKPPGVEP